LEFSTLDPETWPKFAFGLKIEGEVVFYEGPPEKKPYLEWTFFLKVHQRGVDLREKNLRCFSSKGPKVHQQSKKHEKTKPEQNGQEDTIAVLLFLALFFSFYSVFRPKF